MTSERRARAENIRHSTPRARVEARRVARADVSAKKNYSRAMRRAREARATRQRYDAHTPTRAAARATENSRAA